MAGELALGAEVLLGLDDPDAEELGPVAVDRHPGRQRVLRVDQPLRQRQPVHRRARRAGGGAPWARRAATASPGSRKLPLRSSRGDAPLLRGQLDHHRQGRDLGLGLLEPGDLVADRLELGGDRAEVLGELSAPAPWSAWRPECPGSPGSPWARPSARRRALGRLPGPPPTWPELRPGCEAAASSRPFSSPIRASSLPGLLDGLRGRQRESPAIRRAGRCRRSG